MSERPKLWIEKTKPFCIFIKCIRYLLFFVAATAILLEGVNVFARYVMQKSIPGIEDYLTLCMLWLFYLGALYGSYEESHIRGDVLGGFIKSGKGRKIYTLSVYTFAVITMAFWSKWGWEYITWSASTGMKSTVTGIPLTVFQSSIIVGIFSLFIFAIFNLYRYAKVKPEMWEDTPAFSFKIEGRE